MLNHISRQSVVYALALLIAGLTIGPAPPMLTLAQREVRRSPQGTSSPKVLIFKSKGVSQISEVTGPSPLPDLSQAAKKKLLNELNLPDNGQPYTGSTSIYLKLSPGHIFEKHNNELKGYLSFRNPNVVTSDRAYWGPAPDEKEKFVEVHFKSEAAGLYLIDCAVKQTFGPNYPFKIWRGYNDLLQTIESAGAQGQHLVFGLNADKREWHRFRISGGSGWYFYSCEVTKL